MKKKDAVFLFIVIGLIVQCLGLGCYLAYKDISSHTGVEVTDTNKEPEDNITQKDIDQVNKQATDWMDMFKDGVVLKEENVVELNHKYMSKVFVENEYPNKHVQQQWLGVSGVGHFFEKELVQGNGMQIVINAIDGKIEAFEIEDNDKDNVNGTITTYLKIKLKNSSTIERHWIEWNKQPNEGWRVDSVSFNGGVEMLKQPISPKRG
ncbi:hypothetical protein EXW34_31330 (plasmid) [Bacillus mycoides]|uniref:hypothetical protein n=1 Tax=Bacillus mycoides TaxID=1405 RepID=UPI001C01A739|nr:hypothetical protein [Bacillus mycoides]QWI25665.1 hypothetical protein EXW34_31330 [Bacillus mycoides]